MTKNDRFAAMLKEAHRRGFAPAYVVFDSGYSGIENLKLIRSFGWVRLTRLKSNRKLPFDSQFVGLDFSQVARLLN